MEEKKTELQEVSSIIGICLNLNQRKIELKRELKIVHFFKVLITVFALFGMFVMWSND